MESMSKAANPRHPNPPGIHPVDGARAPVAGPARAWELGVRMPHRAGGCYSARAMHGDDTMMDTSGGRK